MSNTKIKTKRTCVIVLGDIGRSPRMQFHVKSLADSNFLVDFVGYCETEPMQEIKADPRINILKLTPFPELYLPRMLKYLFKVMWQILSLLMLFISIKKPDYMLLQNPPGIPTLFMCYLYCKISKAKFVIDWHNYTYTILALQSSENSRIVKIAKWIESYFGKRSINLCVTDAMRQDLKLKWNVNARVLYDRPHHKFQPISNDSKHALFIALSKRYPEFKSTDEIEDNVVESTIFTQRYATGEIKLKNNRPGLLVSSTSWTADEDFQILLNALEKYDETATTPLITVITGKGPLKSFYEKKIEEKKWKLVKFVTPWLENEEYPLLLASADLGVCLHFSTSGLDLPMKVVDMFGCGLPVCALNFKCIKELVKEGKNGFIFNNENELSEQLYNWFYQFPDNLGLVNLKEEFSKNLKKFQSLRWKENWEQKALPLFY